MHTNGEVYDFNKLTLLEQFYHNIISGKVSIKQAKNEQDRMNKMISDLEKYKPTKKDKRDERFLKMQKKKFDGRKNIVEAFEEGIFPMSEKVFHKKQIEKQAEKQVEEKEKKRKTDLKKLVTRLLKKKQKT